MEDFELDDELSKLKGDKKMPLKEIGKRTFHYLKPVMPQFLLSILFLIINVGIDIASPIIIENITDTLSLDMFSYNTILKWVLIYLFVSIVNQFFLYFESMILQKAGQKIIYDLRLEVYDHIMNLSQNQFDQMPVGSLVTRVASYTASLSDLFTTVLVSILRNSLTVIGVFAIMIFKSPILTLYLLPFVFVVFIVSMIFGKQIGKIFRNERRYVSDMNTFLNENLSGMKLTQIFNQEKTKEEEFKVKNKNLFKARYNTTIAFGLYRPFISLLYILAVAVTLYAGFAQGLAPGVIVAFYLYLSKFFNPIQNLADQLNNLQKALTACERLFNLLDVAPEVRDLPDAIDVESFEGKIEFRNVWFAYKGNDWILKDVSFTVNPGETTAFVGATGAGKTTILALIVRNYEIQKGEILIDGIDIKHIKLKSLRKAIGQMLQDVFMFSGTVKSNITLNDETITDEEINNACEYVNANTFIDKLPNGLDEEIIERGENFSQGERQLLSFARTVVSKPQILILDEATSNIDTETEVVIQNSLEKIKNIGTMLVVAHRLSTIQHSDQIIVLQHGEIIERGTHQELLKNKGYYYKLYELQFENRD